MHREHYTVRDMEVRIGHPSGSGPRRVTLEVIDPESDYCVVEFDFIPEEFADLMGSRHMHAMARTPKTRFTDRLFKKREIESITIPAEFGSKWQYEDSAEMRSNVTDWATKIMADYDWDDYRVNLTSREWTATFMRWR